MFALFWGGRCFPTPPPPPRLTVFTCTPDFATQKFLALKQRKAREAGIAISVVEFDGEATTPEIITSIHAAHHTSDGIIVQLPFPSRIPIDDIITAVAPSHDIDCMTYDGTPTDCLPPVVGAINEIANRHKIVWKDAKVVIVGRGRLVGLPSAIFAQARGANVTIVDKGTLDITSHLKEADIIISGAGAPHVITPDMVSKGAVVFDAGTSEDGGELVGDVHPDVADIASIFTPVPGGIGPITIAVLLRNIITPL
ncbi:MAG: tetrahydrofolate dehydrogenase/cyclohydrolase catalytic domain-containing protein [Candidatus Paceibacteria bacterium]